MSKCFLIFLLSFCIACVSGTDKTAGNGTANENEPGLTNHVAQNTDNFVGMQSTPSATIINSGMPSAARKTRCQDYRLETVREGESNLIKVIQENEITKIIKLPTGLSVNGFSLRDAKKSKDGFEFSIDYGSRLYYGKDFHFVCNDGGFYLTKIFVRTHDQADPENSSKESTVRVKPPVSLDDFSIADYMKE